MDSCLQPLLFQSTTPDNPIFVPMDGEDIAYQLDSLKNSLMKNTKIGQWPIMALHHKQLSLLLPEVLNLPRDAG